MCKALDRMEITDIYLVEKTGGKSGIFVVTRAGLSPESVPERQGDDRSSRERPP